MRLAIRSHSQGPPVYGNRLIRAVGAGVDHAQVAERGDVARLLAQNRLESPLRSLVVPGRERPHGSVEDFLRRFCCAQKESAEEQARSGFHTVIILPECGVTIATKMKET